MPRGAQHLTWQIGVAYVVAAVALDWVSNIGLYRGVGVTPWIPSSGLSLAFSFVYGRAGLPFMALAEAAILLFSNQANFSLLWIAVLGTTFTAIWMGAGAALRSRPQFEPHLGTIQALLNLIGVVLLQATAHSVAYISALLFSGLIDPAHLFPISWRLFVGHLVGILVVAPPLIMFHAGWRLPKLTWLHVAQTCVLLAAVWVVFSYRAATTYQLFYLLFLPVLWIALRDGIGAAAIILNIAQIGIIIGAQLRTDLNPGAGSLQILMIALALTGLLVGAVVTDREAAGQRLRDQHAALGRALRLRSAGETAAAISHQINQPITAISTYASVAKEALQDNDLALARTALTKLTDECDRAAAVARSIRDLVKQGALSTASVKLQDLAVALRGYHATECAELGIELVNDIPSNFPTVIADRIQLEQAVENLISNSIEAMHDSGRGSRIRIAASIDAGSFYIEVADDGPGFAPGLDAIATTPFMTTKQNGSGLGLAIARSVAEAHGGSLAVIHRSSGACVRLRLPISGKQNDQSNKHHR